MTDSNPTPIQGDVTGVPDFLQAETMNPGDAHIPAVPPLQAVSVVERPHPLTPLVKTWVATLALILVFGRETIQGIATGEDSPPWMVVGIVVGVVFVIQMILGYFQWRLTQFVIDDHEIRLERNFITHTQTRILFERVQSVDIYAPFVARLFGLRGLRIDAGATDSQHTIEFLPKAKATQLRDYLLARASGVASTPARVGEPKPLTESGVEGSGESAQAFPDRAQEPEPQETVIVQTHPKALLLAAVTSGEVIGPTIIAALSLGFAIWLGRVVPDDPSAITGVTWIVIIVGVIFPLVTALWNTIGAQWNLSVTSTGRGLRINRGLTSTVSRVVPVARIQGIRITQPILWKPFGMYKMRCTVLGDSQAESNSAITSNPTLVAVGDRATIDHVCDVLWPGFTVGSLTWHGLPEKAKWLQPVEWAVTGWASTDFVIATRRGWLSRRIDIVPHARVQSVSVSQGPWQRSLGLATLWADISQGSVSCVCPHMSMGDAQWIVQTELDRTRHAREVEESTGMLSTVAKM